MRPLFIFLAVVVVGIAASKCTSTSTPTTTAASSTSDSAASLQPASAKPTWQYTSWTDKMTGNSGSVAWIQSENTFSLEFPYQGAQHADLTMSEAGIVSIDIKQGQFGCHRSCSVLVKFDDEKPQYYNFHESGPKGESLTTYDDKLWKKVFKAKHATFRIDFFRNNSADLEFDVEGLKPFEKNTKKKT